MIRVTRKNVTLSVHSWSDYLSYVDHSDPESAARIKQNKMPLERTVNGLFLFSNLPFYQRATQMLIVWPAFDCSDSLLTFTGHDPRRIDYAVPQDWWNNFYKQHNRAPEAYWTYEKSNFGEPLFYNTVFCELRRFVQLAVAYHIDQLLTGIDEKTQPISIAPLEVLYADPLHE